MDDFLRYVPSALRERLASEELLDRRDLAEEATLAPCSERSPILRELKPAVFVPQQPRRDESSHRLRDFVGGEDGVVDGICHADEMRQIAALNSSDRDGGKYPRV